MTKNELTVSKKLYITGTGGFAREVLCLIKDLHPEENLNQWVSFLTPDHENPKSELMGINIVKESEVDTTNAQVIVAIGDPYLRKKIVEKQKSGTSFPTVIHPKATVSSWVELAEGCVVTAGTVLTCNIKVGKHAHFNLNSTVGHDCQIADYFTAAPGVNISGDCQFGNFVNLGTNSAVKQGVNITSDTVVGMGGTVVKNLEEAGVYVGVPVKRIK